MKLAHRFICIHTEYDTEGFDDPSNTPNTIATPKEKYLWGLLKGRDYGRSNVNIKIVEERGRSGFAAKAFKAGDFVCQYGGTVRRKPKGGNDWGDERNASLGLGCYCLDAAHNGQTYVFDATASINDPGRYINHARKNCNLTLMPAVMIGEPPNSQLKIGFVAKRDIEAGEELFWNYGIKDQDLAWLSTDAKKVMTTIQATPVPLNNNTADAKKVTTTIQATPVPPKNNTADAKKVKTTIQATPVPPKNNTASQRRRPANRVRRSCPIPGCTTTNVKRLADHVRVLHPQYSQMERLDWLRKARKASTIVSIYKKFKAYIYVTITA